MAIMMSLRARTTLTLYALFIIITTIVSQIDLSSGAGWCDGIERGEACDEDDIHTGDDAQQLHLKEGQQPRDAIWGSGLIETTIEVDVFVAGGGSAGTSAALAAARSGASTVLVNGRPVLGGNSGSEVRLSMVGACGPRSGESNALKMECREGGIVEEYQLDNTVNNPHLVPELFSIELLTLIKAEPNLQLFQNTYFVGVQKVNVTSNTSRITAAIAENQDSQRRYIVKAKTYIDATGDGRLGAEAGAEWIQGREGPDQFNESYAQGPDHETEGTSLDYEAEDKGAPTTFTPPFWAAKYNKTQFQYRGVSGTRPYGYWWNEISYPYNTITDGENVTQEALADLLGIWDYIKNSGDHPESANMGLTWFGNVGCKREGRRFIGQYVSSQNDIYDGKNSSQEPQLYWDRVAYAGWPFDLHNPMGMRDPSHPPFTSHKTPYMFSTPLRSLVSKDVVNLFFAGRLASFSHVVYGSQRVMKTCATMGQATGTAAAYATRNNIDPIDLTASVESVWSIQQQLLRDDAFIIGAVNEDPRDYARNATVTATSESTTSDGPAINVISGQSRAVVAKDGVPVSQGISGSNRWISDGLPASLTLKLDQAAPIAEAQLVFDTGMHRKLSYSVIFKTNNPDSTWGPQPETVRDYSIEGFDTTSNSWVPLCNITGNYQRRRVHQFPCPEPGPGPAPPPAPPPVVAQGAVQANTCSLSSPAQQWTINANGTISVTVNNSVLCLGFDENLPAYGGHGNAVVARPCSSTSVQWKWSPQALGSVISLSKSVTCVGDNHTQCMCVHAVACAACHSSNGKAVYVSPTSVELYTCESAISHVEWAQLKSDGVSSNSGLLFSDGMCLEAPTSSSLKPIDPIKAYPTQPRVQRKEPDPPVLGNIPTISALRVNVTATNGVADAHINEIRLYDRDGMSPFPVKS